MPVPEGRVRLVYAGKDVTRDLARYLLSTTYTDRVEGASDELELEVDDTDGVWRSSWYPTKGDKIQAWMGDQSGTFPCGTFEVDRLTYRGPGVLTIGALAASPTSSVRENRYQAYVKQTLRQIVTAAAGRQGFTVTGTIPDVELARETQDNKTDLAFLADLARDYGLVFSLRGSQLVFTSIEELEGQPAAFSLDLADLQPDFEFTDNLVGSYSSCEVSYHIPKSKHLARHVVTVTDGQVTSSNVLRVHRKVDNDAQAKLLGQAALHRANTMTLTGTVSPVEGDRRLLAGVNWTLTGAGHYSRKWHTLESTHTINRSGGYTVSASIKGV